VPNPFRSGTTLVFAVPDEQPVRLTVYNVGGRLVRTLVDGPRALGWNRVQWDGRDERGERLAAGLYFYRLQNRDGTVTRKGVLLR
jgi:flagellar hook assembly protein FlgD